MQIISKHGLRPTDIRMVIEVIVAGVFIPDDMDQLAAEMHASNTAKNLLYQQRNAGPKSVWSRFGDMFRSRGRHGLEDRG